MDVTDFDGVLVIGGGLAGLSAALAAAPRRVRLITPAPLGEACSSAWAQGGIAAALAEDDAPALHAADTMAAGAGLVEPDRAALLAEEGPSAVLRLAGLGAPFDRDAGGGFVLSREAAHGRARVARVGGDQAGQAIMEAVIRRVRASAHIEILEGWTLRGLVQDSGGAVCGARLERAAAEIVLRASAVILATGGVGGLYAETTTPAALVGEGLAAAALAGAVIADPEFVQFHPTALDIGRDPAPLVTEALRGEGARLVNGSGARFMTGLHPDGELAPRDVVARAIHAERMAGRGAYLDARASVGAHFPQAFPTVYAACRSAGLDPCGEPIPVAPACHYHMGGILTDAEGATSLTGLYAAGECASSGVHGANRLASNSLLEAAVFGARAGRAASRRVAVLKPLMRTPGLSRLPGPDLQALRWSMTREAGVVRDAAGLNRLLSQVDALAGRFPDAGPVIAARLIAECALDRRESRGAHFRLDYPSLAVEARRTLVRLEAGALSRKAA
jgi:L-aspartate oxidase